MQVIADFVWSQVRRERKPRRLVVDEAWTLVQSGVGGRFLAAMARRARKHFLGLTTITQDVADFLSSDEGRAVLQNSALTLLLRQDVSAIDRIVEALKLSAGERDLLLRCGKGQGLLCTPDNRVAVEIVAARAGHRLITSDPRELASLDLDERPAARGISGPSTLQVDIDKRSSQGSVDGMDSPTETPTTSRPSTSQQRLAL